MKRTLELSAVALFALSTTPALFAQTYEWSPNSSDGTNLGGSGTWTNTSTNWWNGTANVAGPNGSTRDAIFGGTTGDTGDTVTLDHTTAVQVRSLIFNTSGYTLSATSPTTLTIAQAAQGVTVNHSGNTTIGANVTVSHAGSAPKWLAGSGTLTIANGGSLVTGSANGSAYITGSAGLTLKIETGGIARSDKNFFIGDNGSNTPGDGHVWINGGTMNVTENFQLAVLPTASARVTIDSGNLNVNADGSNAGVIKLGSGSATFDLNGGIVTTYGVTAATVNSGTFNFNGGTLRVAKSRTGFFTLVANANVKAGGAKIDTNGFDTSIGQSLQSGTSGVKDGGLTKLGAGRLGLSTANTYTGTTLVEEGTLALENLQALQNSTLDLSGDGEVAFAVGGANTYQIGGLKGDGTLDAGENSLLVGNLESDEIAGLKVITAETLTLSPTGEHLFRINGSGRGSDYDALDLTGSLVYGGILNIDFDYAPQETDQFNLFSFTGDFSGTFSEINLLNTDLIAQFDYSTGTLSFEAIPEPATTSLALLSLAALAWSRRQKLKS